MATPELVEGQCALLRRAVEALSRSRSDYAGLDPNDVYYAPVRSGVIKDFEFCYELAISLMYKLVDFRLGAGEKYKGKDKLIKEAVELGFLAGGAAEWKRYQKLRNRTVHVYDEGLARSVAEEDLEQYVSTLNELVRNAEDYVRQTS